MNVNEIKPYQVSVNSKKRKCMSKANEGFVYQTLRPGTKRVKKKFSLSDLNETRTIKTRADIHRNHLEHHQDQVCTDFENQIGFQQNGATDNNMESNLEEYNDEGDVEYLEKQLQPKVSIAASRKQSRDKQSTRNQFVYPENQSETETFKNNLMRQSPSRNKNHHNFETSSSSSKSVHQYNNNRSTDSPLYPTYSDRACGSRLPASVASGDYYSEVFACNKRLEDNMSRRCNSSFSGNNTPQTEVTQATNSTHWNQSNLNREDNEEDTDESLEWVEERGTSIPFNREFPPLNIFPNIAEPDRFQSRENEETRSRFSPHEHDGEEARNFTNQRYIRPDTDRETDENQNNEMISQERHFGYYVHRDQSSSVGYYTPSYTPYSAVTLTSDENNNAVHDFKTPSQESTRTFRANSHMAEMNVSIRSETSSAFDQRNRKVARTEFNTQKLRLTNQMDIYEGNRTNVNTVNNNLFSNDHRSRSDLQDAMEYGTGIFSSCEFPNGFTDSQYEPAQEDEPCESIFEDTETRFTDENNNEIDVFGDKIPSDTLNLNCINKQSRPKQSRLTCSDYEYDHSSSDYPSSRSNSHYTRDLSNARVSTQSPVNKNNDYRNQCPRGPSYPGFPQDETLQESHHRNDRYLRLLSPENPPPKSRTTRQSIANDFQTRDTPGDAMSSTSSFRQHDFDSPHRSCEFESPLVEPFESPLVEPFESSVGHNEFDSTHIESASRHMENTATHNDSIMGNSQFDSPVVHNEFDSPEVPAESNHTKHDRKLTSTAESKSFASDLSSSFLYFRKPTFESPIVRRSQAKDVSAGSAGKSSGFDLDDARYLGGTSESLSARHTSPIRSVTTPVTPAPTAVPFAFLTPTPTKEFITYLSSSTSSKQTGLSGELSKNKMLYGRKTSSKSRSATTSSPSECHQGSSSSELRTPRTRARTQRTPDSASSNQTAEQSTVLMAITEGRGQARGEVGIAAIDPKHPNLILCQISDSPTYIHTLTKIHVLNPAQIIMPNTITENAEYNKLFNLIKEKFEHIELTSVLRRYFSDSQGLDYIRKVCLPEHNNVLLLVHHKFYALSASCALIKYVECVQNLVFLAQSLQVQYQASENVTFIDFETSQKLELVVSQSHKTKSKCSLFAALNHCLTLGGQRRLRSTILQPSCHGRVIAQRLNCVAELVDNPRLLGEIQASLKKFYEIERLLCLCYEPTLLTRDSKKHFEAQINLTLLLKSALESLPGLVQALADCHQPLFKSFKESFSDPRFKSILSLIEATLRTDAMPVKGYACGQMQRCFAVKENVNSLLDVARTVYSEIVDDIYNKAREMSQQFDLPLRVSNSSSRAFHLTFPTRRTFKLSDLPPLFINVSRNKSRTLVAMTTEELIFMNQRIKSALDEVHSMTNFIIRDLLKKAHQHMSCIYKLCEHVAELDLIISLAQVSSSDNYVQPTFGPKMIIKDSRHPLLEFIAPVQPVANHVECTRWKNFHVITGPNMSGKSIYIKQVALLQIMAQVGCYVPASAAQFRLTDLIYSRIGFHDSIECNASTFALEMKEMTHILRFVSTRSLILVDELCRGTSIDEGTSLSWAVCESLIQTKAFVFFTTHFLLLSQLEQMYPNVTNYHLEAKYRDPEQKTGVIYTHKLIAGVTSIEHYGLKLAEKTGLPPSILEEAKILAARLAREKQTPGHYNLTERTDSTQEELIHRLLDRYEDGKLDLETVRNVLEPFQELHRAIEQEDQRLVENDGDDHESQENTQDQINMYSENQANTEEIDIKNDERQNNTVEYDINSQKNIENSEDTSLENQISTERNCRIVQVNDGKCNNVNDESQENTQGNYNSNQDSQADTNDFSENHVECRRNNEGNSCDNIINMEKFNGSQEKTIENDINSEPFSEENNESHGERRNTEEDVDGLHVYDSNSNNYNNSNNRGNSEEQQNSRQHRNGVDLENVIQETNQDRKIENLDKINESHDDGRKQIENQQGLEEFEDNGQIYNRIVSQNGLPIYIKMNGQNNFNNQCNSINYAQKNIDDSEYNANEFDASEGNGCRDNTNTEMNERNNTLNDENIDLNSSQISKDQDHTIKTQKNVNLKMNNKEPNENNINLVDDGNKQIDGKKELHHETCDDDFHKNEYIKTNMAEQRQENTIDNPTDISSPPLNVTFNGTGNSSISIAETEKVSQHDVMLKDINKPFIEMNNTPTRTNGENDGSIRDSKCSRNTNTYENKDKSESVRSYEKQHPENQKLHQSREIINPQQLPNNQLSCQTFRNYNSEEAYNKSKSDSNFVSTPTRDNSLDCKFFSSEGKSSIPNHSKYQSSSNLDSASSSGISEGPKAKRKKFLPKHSVVFRK